MVMVVEPEPEPEHEPLVVIATGSPESEVAATENIRDDKLWVDKYKPKKYVDLLSDETTNRSLLQWLKHWDKVVFNQEVKKKTEKKAGPLSSFNKRTGKFEQKGGWVRRQKHNLNTELDDHHRPIQKIA